ncbi:MAG TPA: c-type cytochrome [bacterium]
MPLSRLRRHIAAPIVLAAALCLLNASVAFAQTPTAQEIIRSHGCPGCHVIPGIPEAQGHIGPTLEGVGSRPRIASGSLKNSPENMRRWLTNPKSVRVTMMPNPGLTEVELDILIKFLQTL